MDFARDWSNGDTLRTGAALGSLALDADSTNRWLSTPGHTETNPILGKHPSKDSIGQYFTAAGLGTVGLAGILPKQIRDRGLEALTGFETTLAEENNNGKGGTDLSTPIAVGALSALAGAALDHLHANFGLNLLGSSKHPGAALTFSKDF